MYISIEHVQCNYENSDIFAWKPCASKSGTIFHEIQKSSFCCVVYLIYEAFLKTKLVLHDSSKQWQIKEDTQKCLEREMILFMFPLSAVFLCTSVGKTQKLFLRVL